jgi:hypothetical protein
MSWKNYAAGNVLKVTNRSVRTTQTPLKILVPRSQTLSGNAFWNVSAFTAYDNGHWEFLKDVDGKVAGQLLIPKDIAATPNAKIGLIIGANATSGVTRMSVLTKAMATDGGAINPASLVAETSQDITVPGTARNTKRVTFTLTNAPTADQLLVFEIFHEGAHANDTVAQNTELYEAYLEFDINNYG